MSCCVQWVVGVFQDQTGCRKRQPALALAEPVEESEELEVEASGAAVDVASLCPRHRHYPGWAWAVQLAAAAG